VLALHHFLFFSVLILKNETLPFGGAPITKFWEGIRSGRKCSKNINVPFNLFYKQMLALTAICLASLLQTCSPHISNLHTGSIRRCPVLLCGENIALCEQVSTRNVHCDTKSEPCQWEGIQSELPRWGDLQHAQHMCVPSPSHIRYVALRGGGENKKKGSGKELRKVEQNARKQGGPAGADQALPRSRVL